MTLVNLSINGLLDPDYLVDELIPVSFEHIERKLVLVINDPNQEESVSLQVFKRELLNFVICECRVGDCDTSGRVS